MSFYSYDPDTYEAITATPGSFKKVVRSISWIVERNIPLRVGIISMPQNEGHEEKTIDYLVSLGVARERIHVDATRPTGRGEGMLVERASSFVPIDMLEKHSYEQAINKASSYDPDYPWNIYSLPTRFTTKDGQAEFASCWNGELVIGAQGEVVPCIFARDHVLGSILDSSLAELIGTPKVERVWGLTLEGSDDCNVCEYRFACFDCRALTYSVTGSENAKPPGCLYNPYDGHIAWENEAQRAFVEQIDDPRQYQLASPHQIVDGAVVANGNIVRVNETGQFLASLMTNPITTSQMVSELVKSTEGVNEQSVTTDVREFLFSLARNSVIFGTDGAPIISPPSSQSLGDGASAIARII